MKVLKNNYKGMNINKTKPYPCKLECENCQSELEYEESDIYIGVYGASHVKCPLCGYENMLDGDEHDITLTKDNIEFPTHFSYTSVETGAIDSCNNEEVKKEIKRAIEYFRNNKNEGHWFTEHGNLYISVFRFDGDENYDVMVTNNYWETYIPFESEDYN